jgi:hypothetical protein
MILSEGSKDSWKLVKEDFEAKLAKYNRSLMTSTGAPRSLLGVDGERGDFRTEFDPR